MAADTGKCEGRQSPTLTLVGERHMPDASIETKRPAASINGDTVEPSVPQRDRSWSTEVQAVQVFQPEAAAREGAKRQRNVRRARQVRSIGM